MTNTYSPTWFELFLHPIVSAQTEREVAFIARQLPQPAHRIVLDLCCGAGRHARLLAQQGYHVTGVDMHAAALAQARSQSADVTYLQQDMRDLSALSHSFDAVICMWQSFGHFDETTNSDILRQIQRKLNPKGRLILDIYQRGFFERHQETRHFERGVRAITETKWMTGKRLTVQLDYGDWRDEFDWRLYTPEEICELAKQVGFEPALVCTEFDEAQAATAEQPRMQVVVEKR